MAVKPVPEGYHTVTPYLVVEGVAELIRFLTKTFDAEVLQHMATPDGVVRHAEIKIGDSRLMMGEASGEYKAMPTMLYLYVEDVDSVYKRAVAEGAVSVAEPANQFYGDRHGAVKDPSGNLWYIATHVEDVPPEEMEKRAQAAMQQRAG